MLRWWLALKSLRPPGAHRRRPAPIVCALLVALSLTALTFLTLGLTSAASGVTLECLGGLLHGPSAAAGRGACGGVVLPGLGFKDAARRAGGRFLAPPGKSALSRGKNSAAAMSSLKVLEVSSFDEFQATMQLVGSGPDVFVLFLGSNEPDTRKSWCPDCRRADPIIMEVFGEVTRPVTLVRVAVGDRATWKGPSNPYRAPPLGVSSVPTLGRWDGRAGRLAGGALGDAEADRPDLVKALIG